MNKINYTIVQISDGSILVGNIINGKAEGHGWLISEPKYEGEFKNNLKHGSGRLFYADGMKTIAEFKNGNIHGHALTYVPSNNDILDQQYIDGVLVSIEKSNQDGSGAISKKNINGQFDGMQTFFLKDGTSHQVLYENGNKVKHPNTGDVEGASSDILPGMIDKIKKTFEDNKKKFDEKIIWNLPLEIENQIKQKVSKNKN